jgi:hypothetical protein
MTIMSESASFRLRTDALPARDRVEIMREVYGRTVLKVDVDPVAPLAVDMTLRGLPGVGIATGSSSPLRAHRSTTLIDNDDIILLLARSGTSLMKHRGREEPVNEGQALIMSGGEVGISQIQPGGLHFINMSFSMRKLAPLVGDLGAVFMRPLPTDSAPMRLLIDYVQAVQAIDREAPAEMWHLAATHMIDLMAVAMGATRDAAEIARGRGVRVARLRAIKADIAAHGANLTTDQIAARHRLSPRYVRKLFEGRRHVAVRLHAGATARARPSHAERSAPSGFSHHGCRLRGRLQRPLLFQSHLPPPLRRDTFGDTRRGAMGTRRRRVTRAEIKQYWSSSGAEPSLYPCRAILAKVVT